MTDYSSVKNTAKNGKLIRAEIREYVLAMALVYGMVQDHVWSEDLYPWNLHRQKQCTLMFLPKVPENTDYKVILFHQNMIQTIRSYFKEYKDTTGNNKNLGHDVVLFYDTKKFRIYYDRLRYGRDYKVNLHRTMQYMWTPVLLTMLYIYGYNPKEQAIDLNKFWFFKNSWNKEDTQYRLSMYLYHTKSFYLKGEFEFDTDEDLMYLEDPEEWRKMAYDNMNFITDKLKAGKYI